MAALSPRFSEEDRLALANLHGLTNSQLMWLERHLGVILDQLGPHDRMDDVRAELRALCTDLAKSRTRVNRWAAAVRPSPGAEALGHLNIAGASFERDGSRPDDGTWPELIVASDLVLLLAEIAKKAVAVAPSSPRVSHRASPRAIETILERLNRPTDAASARAAAALKPRRAETSKRTGPSFRGVADIVFAAAYRALNAHGGNPDAKVPTAATSIRAYLDQLPQHKRRPRGRPRKEQSTA